MSSVHSEDLLKCIEWPKRKFQTLNGDDEWLCLLLRTCNEDDEYTQSCAGVHGGREISAVDLLCEYISIIHE